MAIKYNLTAVEILDWLGYKESGDTAELKDLEQKNNVKLPVCFKKLLSMANHNPLLATADIWTDRSPYFSYDDIKERLEDDKDYWMEHPEECDGDEYYSFSQIPAGQWPDHVSNYLQIGSDYAAGIAVFGIRAEDLKLDNPPVYMLHEADSLTDWKVLDNTLTDFFMRILCDALCCAEYSTAKRVLQQAGWNYYKCDESEEVKRQLSQRGIDLREMKKYSSLYGVEVFYRCGYEEENNTLFIIRNDKDENCKAYMISKGNK